MENGPEKTPASAPPKSHQKPAERPKAPLELKYEPKELSPQSPQPLLGAPLKPQAPNLSERAKQNVESFINFIKYALDMRKKGYPNYVYEKNGLIREAWLREGFLRLTEGIPLRLEDKNKIQHELINGVDTVMKDLLENQPAITPENRKLIYDDTNNQVINFINRQYKLPQQPNEEITKRIKQNINDFSNSIRDTLQMRTQGVLNYVYSNNGRLREGWLDAAFKKLSEGIPLYRQEKEENSA